MSKLELALKNYKIIRKDKTTEGITRKHVWELAYWYARQGKTA